MAQTVHEAIRRLSERRAESEEFELSTAQEQQLDRLTSYISYVFSGREEKVLCLCHSCGGRTLSCIHDPSLCQKPYWVTKKTVLNHIKGQLQHPDPAIAAQGQILQASKASTGIRSLDIHHYLVLVQISLKLQSQQPREHQHLAPRSSPSSSAGASALPSPEAASDDLRPHRIDSANPASPAQGRVDREHWAGPQDSRSGSEDSSAEGNYNDTELPEYTFLPHCLIGHWDQWPSRLAQMSGKPSDYLACVDSLQ